MYRGSVSQNRWHFASLLWPGGGHREAGRAQNPEVDVQQSTAFRLHPRSFLAVSVPLRRLLMSLSLSLFLSPILSLTLPLSHPSISPLPLASNFPLSTALLSGVAPSRVHPIPVFNWDINKVCLALPFDQLAIPGNWDWDSANITRSA